MLNETASAARSARYRREELRANRAYCDALSALRVAEHADESPESGYGNSETEMGVEAALARLEAVETALLTGAPVPS